MKTLDKFDLSGRTALVTGAASGIGLAYAEAMAEAGASVTLADIDNDGAEREAERLRVEGFTARAAKLDVSDAAATAQVFDDHAAAYGGLDIACANAGIDTGAGFWNPAGHRNPDGQVDTYDPARWDKSIAVNLSGMFYTVSNAVRIMKQPGRANGRSGGAVICTASNAGLVTEPIVGLPYMPAKAGILHMGADGRENRQPVSPAGVAGLDRQEHGLWHGQHRHAGADGARSTSGLPRRAQVAAVDRLADGGPDYTPYGEHFMVQCGIEAVARIVDAMRPLRIANVIPNVVLMMSAAYQLAMFGLGMWNTYFALYGTEGMISENQKNVRAAFGAIDGEVLTEAEMQGNRYFSTTPR